MLTSNDLRTRFLAYFKDHGHAVIPSASLVPENDPSVLFNTAGMQPLVPYLLGQPHPMGVRLVDSQKCVRTGDIDEVGDNTHLTFFEMLGNWSLGDYFKQDMVRWSFELLTSREKGFGIDANRLYVTVFAGNTDAPRDDESYGIWRDLFAGAGINPDGHIFWMETQPSGKEPNWWSPGDNGPCGPDTEMFYDVTPQGLGDLTKEEYLAADDRQEVVEIWNDVFMEYEKKDGKVIGKLAKQNVDTGSGLERLTMVLQGKNNVFDTDMFIPAMAKTRELSSDERSARIIADHLRTALFLIGDGVRPAPADQGYILRRLIRRAVMRTIGRHLTRDNITTVINTFVDSYSEAYPNLRNDQSMIIDVITEEAEKFHKTLENGIKVFMKHIHAGNISGKEAFDLYQSYGFPIEITEELAKDHNVMVDIAGYKAAFEEHQAQSRAGAEQKFKGGLADHSEMSVKYHTATHLLHQALRTVLGETATQKGSNITVERLRFDFAHPQKMTPEEIKKTEDIVNDVIKRDLPVFYEDVPYEEARRRGAIGLFDDNYQDIVRVYQVGRGDEKFSLEFCGGPHVEHTGQLGTFKIAKEEASSQGVRRIKAVLS